MNYENVILYEVRKRSFFNNYKKCYSLLTTKITFFINYGKSFFINYEQCHSL